MKLIIAAVFFIVATQASAQTFVATKDGDITAIMALGNPDIRSVLSLSIDGVQSFSYVHSSLTKYDTTTNFGHANAGDVIVFSLEVLETGYTWSTDTSKNIDDFIHFTYAEGQETFIGFESGYGYGDGSMDDSTAYFTNVSVAAPPVPEPEAYLMLMIGLGLILAKSKYRF